MEKKICIEKRELSCFPIKKAVYSLFLFRSFHLAFSFNDSLTMASQIARRLLHNRSPKSFGRSYSSGSSDLIRATLFPGDGIGPEIATSVKQILNAADVPIEWEEHYVGTEVDPRTQSFVTWESLESVVRGVVESLKIITRQASLRVAEYAFHYAKAQGSDRVSAIHKANIMQKTDGLFFKCCQEVAEKYPEIKYEEVVIDNCWMMLVKNPSLFDVLVMPNLYGDIISDLCAGLIGGLGLTPSLNIGEGGIALAEAVHGSAPNIAGKNLANPTALLLSAVSMLRHLGLHDKADRIKDAVLKTIAEGKYRTADLGGSSNTSDFTKAIIDHL